MSEAATAPQGVTASQPSCLDGCPSRRSLFFSRGIPLHKLSGSKPRSLDFARDDSGDRR
jgi:hypothetical protein